MKLTANNIEDFMKTVQSCKGPVYLTDWEVDENGEHNFVLNLKSKLSMYIGLGKLLGEHGDWFEVYTSNHEDEVKIIEFLANQNQ